MRWIMVALVSRSAGLGGAGTSRPAAAIGAQDVVQIDGTCVRTTTGSVACLSGTAKLVEVAGISDAVDLAANDVNGCVARKSGAVACWFAQFPTITPYKSGAVPGVRGAI